MNGIDKEVLSKDKSRKQRWRFRRSVGQGINYDKNAQEKTRKETLSWASLWESG